MTAISVLKPGLLVSLKTSVRGGVNYRRVDLESDHTDEKGARVARWETLREIPDPAEFERAHAARGKARSLVAGVCCPSSFGLLCPSDKEVELKAAIEEARSVTRAHNAAAVLTQVSVYVLMGRIAQTDEEAARAISAELRELLEQMQAGITAADPEAIREAANKARALGGMLSAEVAGKVSAAVKEARDAARLIVAKVEKAGLTAADVVKVCSVQAIESARFAFLDLEEAEAEAQPIAARPVEIQAEEEPAPAQQAGSMSLPFALEV